MMYTICIYLYSLEGALLNLHWNDIPSELKGEQCYFLIVKPFHRTIVPHILKRNFKQLKSDINA